MKIAGLDFSKIDLDFLKRSDLDIIYNAFVTNLEMNFGALTYTPADKIINNLRRYIEINLLDENNAAINSYDLHMAMSIYMLPEYSKSSLINIYINIINTLRCKDEVYALRAQPFKVDIIMKMWELLKTEKDRLNITGFWKHSVNELYAQVCDQPIIAATLELDNIKRNFKHNTLEIVTRIIYYIYVLKYIDKNRGKHNSIINMYYYKKYNLLNFNKKVLSLLRDDLEQLHYMPDNPRPSIVSSCGVLLFRAATGMREVATAKHQRKNMRVAPG